MPHTSIFFLETVKNESQGWRELTIYDYFYHTVFRLHLFKHNHYLEKVREPF